MLFHALSFSSFSRVFGPSICPGLARLLHGLVRSIRPMSWWGRGTAKRLRPGGTFRRFSVCVARDWRSIPWVIYEHFQLVAGDRQGGLSQHQLLPDTKSLFRIWYMAAFWRKWRLWYCRSSFRVTAGLASQAQDRQDGRWSSTRRVVMVVAPTSPSAWLILLMCFAQSIQLNIHNVTQH